MAYKMYHKFSLWLPKLNQWSWLMNELLVWVLDSLDFQTFSSTGQWNESKYIDVI